MAGGIFCIENWSPRLDSPDSVLPILEFLAESDDRAPYIHQRVSTRRELGYYLGRFSDLRRYPVGYLALHGDPGKVYVGSTPVRLETLTAWAGDIEKAPALDGHGEPKDWVLDLGGKVVYLGSCSTLKVSRKRLREFKESTGAVAVCGYERTVPWFDSGGFEIILLSALAEAMDPQKTRNTARETVRRLWRDAGDLMGTLGFVCEPDWRP